MVQAGAAVVPGTVPRSRRLHKQFAAATAPRSTSQMPKRPRGRNATRRRRRPRAYAEEEGWAMGSPGQCRGPQDRDGPLDIWEFKLSTSPGMRCDARIRKSKYLKILAPLGSLLRIGQTELYFPFTSSTRSHSPAFLLQFSHRSHQTSPDPRP